MTAKMKALLDLEWRIDLAQNMAINPKIAHIIAKRANPITPIRPNKDIMGPPKGQRSGCNPVSTGPLISQMSTLRQLTDRKSHIRACKIMVAPTILSPMSFIDESPLS